MKVSRSLTHTASTNHPQAFTEMRNYYNSITQDNLALIKSLNDEIEDLKVKHAQNEKAMEEIARKNAQVRQFGSKLLHAYKVYS